MYCSEILLEHLRSPAMKVNTNSRVVCSMQSQKNHVWRINNAFRVLQDTHNLASGGDKSWLANSQSTEYYARNNAKRILNASVVC